MPVVILTTRVSFWPLVCHCSVKLVTTNTMDLLKSYESDESSSEEPGKSLSEDSLLRSDLRSVYLVTYSQADIT